MFYELYHFPAVLCFLKQKLPRHTFNGVKISPAVAYGNNSGMVLGDLEEHGHGEVEVGARRVAPAAIVAGKGEVGRAEVGGGDDDGRPPRVAPPWILVALYLETRAATQPTVEQCRAQCCSVHPIPLAV